MTDGARLVDGSAAGIGRRWTGRSWRHEWTSSGSGDSMIRLVDLGCTSSVSLPLTA